MKQVLQNFKTGELLVMEVPQPTTKPGGVLVAVSASLISVGTEKMVVNLAQASLLGKARRRPDQVRQVIEKVRQVGLLTTYEQVINRLDSLMPLGYSCAGTVIEVGEGVKEFQVGDRVACGGGGYANHAEVVFVPKNLVSRIPNALEKAISFEEAAFTTVGAIALQGIRQTEPTMGETIAVVGLGLLGLLTVQLLKANGCQVIGMDINAKRCQLAESLGCDGTATENGAFLSLVENRTKGNGVDAVLITAGTKSNSPIELAADACRERGRITAVGLVSLDVPRRVFYDKELDLRLSRSYGPGRYDPKYEEGGQDYPIGYVRWTENRNMAAFLDLLAQGKIQLETMITHRFDIDEAAKAYNLITGQADEVDPLAVILKNPHADRITTPLHGLKTVRLTKTSEIDSSTSTPNKAQVQVALIGAGTFARGVLLPALKKVEGSKLRAISNSTGSSARHLADKYKADYCTSSVDELLSDKEVDAILVATRHDSHASLVLKGLEAGKHVFVEKPLALSDSELETVATAYYQGRETKKGSKTVMVGFNRRFAPLSIRLKDFVNSIDEPLAVNYRVNAGFIPTSHWIHDSEIGGGRIIGELCHFFDFLLFLTGEKPINLYAQSLPNLGRYNNDNLTVSVSFDGGSIGTIMYMANGDKTFPKEVITVFGGGTAAELNDFRSLILARDGRSTKHRSQLKQDKGHQAELKAFINALRDNSGEPIPFQESVITTKATFRIQESLRSGKVVKIDDGSV